MNRYELYAIIHGMNKSKSDAKQGRTEYLNKLLEGLAEERKQIVESLVERKWFKKTSFDLQKDLLNLPEDYNGFLKDLGNRPETIGQVEVLKLVKLAYGNFQIIPVFEVRSNLTNEVFTYEYSSWKYGRFPGYKGIILVESDNQIKFFFIKKGEKFPTGSQVYDAIGTHLVTFSNDKLIHLPSNIENQVKKLLGVNDIQFKRFIDLGIVNPDPGMTNNHTAIFATIINIVDAERIQKKIGGKQLMALAPGYELEIHPIERLLEFVAKSDDSYFLACVARLQALNIIKL